MSLGKSAEGQELLCINTEKVYDWILNETSFDLNLDNLELPVNPVTGAPLECEDIEQSSVTCSVSPAVIDPVVISGREDQIFVIDGEEVTLQFVTIRKSFDVTIYVSLVPELGGATVEVGTTSFERCEQVILCAPEGTEVNVSYTDLDCYVCSVNCETGTTTEADELNVMVTVRLCQSIQSTYKVTLELEAYFCQPRDMLPFPSCPTPPMPPQCPVIFPNTLDADTEQEEKWYNPPESTHPPYVEEDKNRKEAEGEKGAAKED